MVKSWDFVIESDPDGLIFAARPSPICQKLCFPKKNLSPNAEKIVSAYLREVQKTGWNTMDFNAWLVEKAKNTP